MKLIELVKKIRSKNAGPFLLTIDIFFSNKKKFIKVLKNLTKKHSPEFEYVYNIFLDKSWEEFCGGRYSELVKNKKDTSLYAQNDGHPNDKGNEEWFKHLLKEIK